MKMDGYVDVKIASNNLLQDQMKINDEIYETFDQIRNMPRPPSDINKWISSVDFSPKAFKLSDLVKMRTINKKMHSLMAKQEETSQKLKMLAIEDLINQINDVLK
jgi:hypothetical protein